MKHVGDGPGAHESPVPPGMPGPVQRMVEQLKENRGVKPSHGHRTGTYNPEEHMSEVDPQPEGQAAITGYRLMSDETVNQINQNKELERDVARQWRWLKGQPDADPRMLNHARTQLQDGFMWLNRALALPEDPWEERP